MGCFLTNWPNSNTFLIKGLLFDFAVVFMFSSTAYRRHKLLLMKGTHTFQYRSDRNLKEFPGSNPREPFHPGDSIG